MQTSDEIFDRALLADRPPATTPLDKGDYGLTRNPQPHVSRHIAIRLSNLVSNDVSQLFTPATLEQSTNSGTLKNSGGFALAHPRDPDKLMCVIPKPLLRQVFNAARHISLNTVTPQNLPDWIVRLRLLQALDVHFFFKDEAPCIPSCKELSYFFGIEFFGFAETPQDIFIKYLTAHINRKVALDLQSGLAGELPSEKFLPFVSGDQ